MIVVDASALLAVLLDEPDRDDHLHKLLAATGAKMSAVNYWETLVRMDARYGPIGVKEAEKVFLELSLEIEPATAADARAAALAFRSDGQRSLGGLNLGDCFAYALARKYQVPLLFKGDGFPKTGVERA